LQLGNRKARDIRAVQHVNEQLSGVRALGLPVEERRAAHTFSHAAESREDRLPRKAGQEIRGLGGRVAVARGVAVGGKKHDELVGPEVRHLVGQLIAGHLGNVPHLALEGRGSGLICLELIEQTLGRRRSVDEDDDLLICGKQLFGIGQDEAGAALLQEARRISLVLDLTREGRALNREEHGGQTTEKVPVVRHERQRLVARNYDGVAAHARRSLIANELVKALVDRRGTRAGGGVQVVHIT